ncbi:FAD-dependent oxidoreductase [Bacterioplanes sanyensis]|uniref:FAD-dependent oxidoreductase n=1 Tax=Bacterioplanes sanyensis TaxID=1249553 RepID=A0A222FIT9_9GAMM|nr:FAD-dependent oxidoreductase [Bacterioplanes sanyensis]ASP38669.1 FAD-dependent oxidoreductase [Bacterioplanes sanyensis]
MNRQRIAIIGSGISGLTCAYLLHEQYDVTVYEANDYLGGHTQTTDVAVGNRSYPVNTGFIVFNDWTYPNFIQLMDRLGVASENSDMSFSVKCEQTDMEYNGHDLNSLFAKRSHLISPRFWFMIRDILRFNRETRAELDADDIDQQETLGSYLQRKGYGDYFRRYYIIPMGAAVWSASEDMMMQFPVYFFIRFFNNHGMLSVDDRPQWRVISGGSRTYVEKIQQQVGSERFLLNEPVQRIERHSDHVVIHSPRGSERFDQVILSCHSDQALSMLDTPTLEEQKILSAIPYKMNDVVLHTDAGILPRRKAAWAAWNYHIDPQTHSGRDAVAVTYYMNRLQNYEDAAQTFCVTLNKTADINPDKIIRRFQYAHPVFTLEGMAAQQRHEEISGINRTHYCGAYWFNGFHEDGVRSALRVTERLGVSL